MTFPVRRFIAIVAAATMALLVAGCREEQLVAPIPDFSPPTVRLPGPIKLPEAGTPEREKMQQQAQISTVAPATEDKLLAGAAITPKVKARAWKYIIIHHSDTSFGCALRFHKAHLARGWDMLGYDFVIGNGTETRDGLIEVGPRWVQQLDGAHTGTPDHEYNMWGIGICLVGNFDDSRPTAAQMDSLARLVATLMKTYNIPANRVLGHGDCKPTNCPGRHMDIAMVRAMAQQMLAK